MATSLTSGLTMRKVRVAPMGTPAATNPMNAGTALHEQNGVATPRPAAITLPTPSRRSPSSARVGKRSQSATPRRGDALEDAHPGLPTGKAATSRSSACGARV